MTSLADDLLIHVTGFFRDPEAWEALRRKVIVPLVEAREPGGAVRAWVTACSSGEEAYTLAILLAEESERIGKRLDIKIFATDLAQRALAHARAGIYPGGIESEIDPSRLDRFFIKQDSVYQVRPALRDRVVFAPQNVLQDPPFSRLDIATCRNLLIYLEPDVQQRVLSLLHFGLREGGALFLGSTEMVAGTEELFELVDKKARIFRRVGPTRHGSLDFPLPDRIRLDDASQVFDANAPGPPKPLTRRQDAARTSVAEISRRVLLEAHTPPAVTVDRDGHILYYHGDTQLFLQQLTGEPSRDLLLLIREGLRGAVRTALQRAAAEGRTVLVPEGWVEAEPGRSLRIEVTASPVGTGPRLVPGDRPNPPDYFVVSFEQRGDLVAAPVEESAGEAASIDELRRLRAELQGTIEELQTSNEELKASHEEVVSMNEELQSANEELETSKEEMQSLNEELSTLNSQLRIKMEDHQTTSSDLASLLASTDIAVLFLDTGFRIRRYTPAFRDLVDLIASDVGRPLAALARRFDDPLLDEDCRTVLERLVPVEREVTGADGRHYLRRVLPYRTTDNRIDGVVLTFVDISAWRRAEERLRRMLNVEVVGVMIFDETGTLIEANDAFLQMSGYNHKQVEQRVLHWRTMTLPEYIAASERQMKQLAETGRLGPYEKEYIRRDGSRSWMLFAGASLGDGTVVEYCVDIAKAKAGEAALRESEKRFRLALQAARMGVWTIDKADVQTRDGNLNRLLGLEPVDSTQPFEDFLGHIHPADREAVATAFTASAVQGRPLSLEFRVVWPDGTLRWLRDQGDVFQSGDGKHMTGACVDVTERRQAEDALRESEEQFRRAIEDAPIPVIMHAEDGEVLQISRTWTELTGFALSDLPTIDAWLNRAYGPGADAVRDHMHELFGGDRKRLDVEFTIRTRNGTDRHWSFSASAPGTLRDGRRFVVGMAVDITDRKRAEDELRAGEERLRLVVMSATDYAIFTQGPDRLVTSWSPGATAAFGYSEEEMLGRSADIIFTPEDRASGVPEGEARIALKEGRAADERWHLRRDGSRFFASGVLTPLGQGGSRGFVKVARDLTERKRMEDELRVARDEMEIRVVERTGELERANDALQEALAARRALLRRVVTAQEDERRRISRELHDTLGQELTALILGLQSLKEVIPEETPGRDRLQEIVATVSRIGREAHDLAIELRPTALDDLGLESALAAYVAQWSERTGVAAEFQPLGLDGDRMPSAVESTVYRVVQEALNNVAKHARARRVSIIVERRGGELIALVEDDGIGFDPGQPEEGEERRRLGLLGMRERVDQVGGSLLIESGEGDGTTIRARIPLDQPAGEADHDG